MANRIQEKILEPEGLEEQNGFVKQRGCCDGIFTVKMALQKRHEHGLSTWAVFIDLVKAFDSVPRNGLFAVLQKFGIPPKMLRLIIRFHSDLIVKVAIGEDDVCFNSTTGVKQGCTMAPLLFAIYFQAANEVLTTTCSLLPTLVFRTAKDFVFTGRKINQCESAIDFTFEKSLYADDKTKLSDSRENLLKSLQLIFTVFRQFGLVCHVGRNGSKSKTEAMYFPAPGLKYEDADTSPLQIDGGEVPFTLKFKLLGSILAYNLKDDDEIEARIRSAQGAFQSIRIQFFSAKGIKNVHKKTAYEGLVLSILLYGCETWSLTKQQLNRLQMFHNRCVRAMCRVTMWHVREHRITQQSLESRIQLEPFQYYLARRRLRWAGHVSRMDFTRLPRMFLSSWVDHKRPQGRPQLNYGHGLLRDLQNAGVHVKAWDTLASDRNLWHSINQQKNVHCNANGGGYAWQGSELIEQAKHSPLPPPSSYAGVLLGLSSLPTPSPIATSPAKPTLDSPVPSRLLTIPSPRPLTPIHAPPLRCSRRLAAKAELTGGRKTYSRDDRRLKPSVFN